MKTLHLGRRLASLLCGGLLACSMIQAEVTPDEIADLFYKLNYNPKTPHMKINHTKGFCAIGEFHPSSQSGMFDIPLLKQKNIKTLVRYSLGGAEMNDGSKTRGLVVKFEGNDSSTWTMVMLNTKINFAKNPEEFKEFFKIRIPVNGKPDMQNINKVTQATPSFRNFAKYVSEMGVYSSVATTPYYSIHTFWIKDSSGKEVAARWRFEPEAGEHYLSANELKNVKKDFLEQDFKDRLEKNKTVKYRMYFTLANPGDPTDDTTALWKGSHKEILLGELIVNRFDGHGCNSEVYFPSDLPAGVNPPKDPLFDLRNAVYAITFGRRQ